MKKGRVRYKTCIVPKELTMLAVLGPTGPPILAVMDLDQPSFARQLVHTVVFTIQSEFQAY